MWGKGRGRRRRRLKANGGALGELEEDDRIHNAEEATPRELPPCIRVRLRVEEHAGGEKHAERTNSAKRSGEETPLPALGGVRPKIDRAAFYFEDDDGRDDGGEKIRQADPQESHDAAVLFVFHARRAGVHAHAVSAPADDCQQCPCVPRDAR